MIFSTTTDYQESDFRQAYKKLLDHKGSMGRAVSKKKPPGKYNSGEVLFVCDYEGIIQYQSKFFSCHEAFGKSTDKIKNSILDLIHPEDVPLTIEQLVLLLQQRTESIVIEARFLCEKKQYRYTRWHVAFLRGMFYFYPLDVPVSGKNLKTVAAVPENKDITFWKNELEKTLASWDETVLEQLRSCINI